MKHLIRNLMAMLLCVMALSLTACGEVTETGPSSPPGTSEATAVDDSRYVKLKDPLAQPGCQAGEASYARNFQVVLDASGSMAGSAIVEAKQAIHAFVNGLPKDREINLGLVVFDSSGIREPIALGSPESKNRARFLKEVDSVEAGGGTPLADAINVGTAAMLKQCQRQLNYGDYRQIIVTDGAPDWGQNLDVACSEAASYGFAIYTIGFGIGDGHPLKNWATSYETASSADELTQKLQNTAAEPEEYVPTYSPTTPTK